MADKTSGSSADAEEPLENEMSDTEPEAPEAAVEVGDEAEPVEEAAEAEVAVEAAAEAEPVEAATEPEAVVEPADEADEPAASPADDARGTSAEAEVPSAKRKRKRVPRSERRQRPRKKREAAATRKPIVRLEKPEHVRSRRQERQGTVVSDGMEKTIVVRVDVIKAHPRYKKVVRRSVKFHAHDETSEAKVGDIVRIVETRPLSKTKRWRLAEVVEAAK
jgi:small subunit ribosomal protein S17